MSAPIMTCKMHQKSSMQYSIQDKSIKSPKLKMANHDMSQMAKTSKQNMKMQMPCCDDSCHCFDNMCITPIYILTSLPNILIESQSNNYQFPNPLFSNQQQSSAIFHPPILS